MKKNDLNRQQSNSTDPRRESIQSTLAILSQAEVDGGPCPAPEDLAAFSEGKVRGSKRKAMVNHLNHCDTCRRQILLIQSTIDEIAEKKVPWWSVIYDKARNLFSWKKASGGMGLALATCLLLVFLVPRQNELQILLADSYKSLPQAQVSQYISFDSRGETGSADAAEAPYLHAYLAGRATGKASLSSPDENLPKGYFKDDIKNMYFALGQWSILLECTCLSGGESPEAFWKKQRKITGNIKQHFEKQSVSNTMLRDTNEILTLIDQIIQNIQSSGNPIDGCNDVLTALTSLQYSLQASSDSH